MKLELYKTTFLQTILSIVNSKFFFWFIILLFPTLTFNFYSPDYDIGLDTSYAWAYNSLFLNKFSSLQKIVYPYGLFGFVKMPFPYLNLYVISFVFVFLIKSIFCYLVLKAIKGQKLYFILFNLVNLFYCCDYLFLDYIVLGNLIIVLINQYYSYKKYFFIGSSLLLLCGMLLKVNIMINGMVLYLFSFLLTALFSKEKKSQIVNYLLGILLFIVLGALLYGGPKNFITFIKGSFIMSGGYNEALCFSNTVSLLYFIPLLILLILLTLNSFFQKKYIELILAAFVFFAWKHTIVRLDSGHFYNLIMSLVLFTAIWIALDKKYMALKYMVCIGCIVCFYFFGKKMSVFPDGMALRNGLKEFIYTTSNLRSIIKKCDSITTVNYNKSKLPEIARNIISNSKIDSYPFELSYFKDASINYTPRYTLQSGSNSSWLDNYSKNSIEQQKIEFYIFHKTSNEKIKLMSIDYKYLFNEEPVTLMYLLSDYNTVYLNSSFALLQKTTTPKLIPEKINKTITSKFNQWIPVPGDNEHVYRLKTEFKKPFAYKVKSFFYKPSTFYITYKFIDDSVSERLHFVPANAKDGLWINPFYFDFKVTRHVKEIFIESGDKLFDSEDIQIIIDSYKINKEIISSSDSLFALKNPEPNH